jgi:DNA helicase HerA-like ATPase
MSNSGESRKKLAEKGILRPELRVGVVSFVKSYIAHINLRDAGTPSGTYFEGGRYGRGEVGEFVLIEGQRNILLGRIIEVRLPEGERQTISQDFDGSDDLDAIGHIQLLGSISMADFHVTSGVDTYPRLGDRVYVAPHQLIALIPGLMTKTEDLDTPVQLELGAVGAANESKVSITPDKLFGRHCAILGATGGGKSWTTARIIEECIKHKSKIILLDATGEYRGFNGAEVMHCHLGEPVHKAETSIACSLPPTSFQESDFMALFQPACKVQGPKLQEAIRSLRLAKLYPELAQGGYIVKANKFKSAINEKLSDPTIGKKVADPNQEFDITLLAKQIEEECVWPSDFAKSSEKWGNYDGNSYSSCINLINRIYAVISSGAYKCVFGENTEDTITNIILEFIKEDSRLLRICLSGIQHEFYAREIIANTIGRYLLSLARIGSFKENPTVIVVDEAHHFLGVQVGSEEIFSRLDAFELIAKEGRKFGLSICLATQRPRDITEGVLSQMGTLIVHRLTNDRDREIVERACGEIDRSASSFLPNLQPGEAAIIGVDFPFPLTIQISKPTFRPKSDGPNYQEHWRAE